MTARQIVGLLPALSIIITLPGLVKAQSLVTPADSSTVTLSATAPLPQLSLTYQRPTQKMKLRSYLFEAFGPYPVMGAAFAAGINQAYNTPPEWRQGAAAYGKRFASDFGIAAVTTTTRYALAQGFHEDTLYYRCECKGVWRRLGHAMISTVTARRDDDGHRVFSVPALVSPYVGSMTAVYGWYPGRFGAKDALRIGNYNLLGFLGANIAMEFLHNGHRSLLTRLHLNNARGAPDSGSN